jgi:hypothetical protein
MMIRAATPTSNTMLPATKTAVETSIKRAYAFSLIKYLLFRYNRLADNKAQISSSFIQRSTIAL